MEFEAVDDGVIGKLLVSEGAEGVKVNAPIALLLEDGEDSPTPQSQESAASVEAQPNTSAPAQVSNHSEPPQFEIEVPEGTEMKSTTVREALRDAMAEEMRRDETVYLMGEEVDCFESPSEF